MFSFDVDFEWDFIRRINKNYISNTKWFYRLIYWIKFNHFSCFLSKFLFTDFCFGITDFFWYIVFILPNCFFCNFWVLLLERHPGKKTGIPISIHIFLLPANFLFLLHESWEKNSVDLNINVCIAGTIVNAFNSQQKFVIEMKY